MSTWYFRGQTRDEICQYELSRSLILSKRDHDVSHAKCRAQVLIRFSALLLSMRTPTVATASKRVTIITSTHNFPLSPFHFILCIINKVNPEILDCQISSLVCLLRNHVTLLFSHQSLSTCKDGGYRE